MNEATKLKFQLSRAQKESNEWKAKCAAKDEEFVALQGCVTLKMKERQQTINRLEQQVLELKRVRDVLTRDYEKVLRLNTELGKGGGDKAALLADTVERMAQEIAALRADLDASREHGRHLEEELANSKGL
jgi:chromosome segregation ATPase